MCAFPFEGIIGLGGTVVGTFLGYWLSRRAATAALKEQNFRAAGGAFRAAFVEVQRCLDESKTFDRIKPNGIRVRDILEKHIVEHEKAMILFRAYLPATKLAPFAEAWKDYYSQKNENAECLTDYKSEVHTNSIVVPAKEKDLMALSLSRIKRLLSFAEPQ